MLLLMPISGFAQKKVISAARANIKNGQNLEDAENSMRNLLKDTANLHNEKIWLTLFDAVKKQYDQLNEKLYLKQQSDTAKLFRHTLHMFDVLESLDSIDNIKGKNGKVEHSYRKRHGNFLDSHRANLFNGGLYFIKKQSFDEAYRLFDCYIDCAEQPLFEDFDYASTDERLPEAAYWSMFCGYKLKDAQKIDKYTDLAKIGGKHEVYMLQYIAESYLQKNDTANYRKTLETGFAKYPEHLYFFSHLAIYYGKIGLHREVLDISEKALEHDENNVSALVALSSAYYQLHRYDECVSASDKVIDLGVMVPIVFANAGFSYYVQSITITKKVRLTDDDKSRLRLLYKRALPYFEKYREMRPEDADVWGKPLYNIYLNLNMGEQFEEIDAILNK